MNNSYELGVYVYSFSIKNELVTVIGDPIWTVTIRHNVYKLVWRRGRQDYQ